MKTNFLLLWKLKLIFGLFFRINKKQNFPGNSNFNLLKTMAYLPGAGEVENDENQLKVDRFASSPHVDMMRTSWRLMGFPPLLMLIWWEPAEGWKVFLLSSCWWCQHQFHLGWPMTKCLLQVEHLLVSMHLSLGHVDQSILLKLTSPDIFYCWAFRL